MKKWEMSVVAGLVITIILSLFSFNAQCGEIRDSVLRLHVLANSDSAEDQELKFKIRDKLLSECSDIFKNADDEKSAANAARDNIGKMTGIAEDEIRRNGYSYPVTVRVEKTVFDTKSYDGGITFPSGEYEAVRILIGDAEGENWWCVLFPPMCLPAAKPKEEIKQVFSDRENEIVTNKPKYEIRFKAVEIINAIKGWFR